MNLNEALAWIGGVEPGLPVILQVDAESVGSGRRVHDRFARWSLGQREAYSTVRRAR